MTDAQREIQKALDIAWATHRLEWRKSSPAIPYITHIFDVVRRLDSWGLTTDLVDLHQTAILHDVLESGATLRELFDGGIPNHVILYVGDLTFLPGDVPKAEEKRLKAEYLASFADKPLVPLVTKVADRLCNVYDFARGGDKAYARKYWEMAEPLFSAFVNRKQEIVDWFGMHAYDRALEDSGRVADRAFSNL